MSRKGGSRVEAAMRNPSYLRVANVLGLKNLDSNNDIDAIEEYIKENGDPYQNALDAANQAAKDIAGKSVDDLNNLTIGFNDSIANLTSSFDERYGSLEAGYNKTIGELEDFIQDQSSTFDKAFADQRSNFQGLLKDQESFFGGQLDSLNGLLIESQGNNERLQGTIEETNRIASNQANAYVPDANPNAVGATAGDDREQLFSTTRKKSRNGLDDLSLLTGVGTQGNPLAGLQLP